MLPRPGGPELFLINQTQLLENGLGLHHPKAPQVIVPSPRRARSTDSDSSDERRASRRSLLDRGLGAESEGLAWAFELGTRGERMSHGLCPAFCPSQGLPGNRAHGLGPASGSPRWLMTLSLYFLGHLG